MTKLEIYLLQTIYNMVEIAHGIDNREAMLKALGDLESNAEHAVREHNQEATKA